MPKRTSSAASTCTTEQYASASVSRTAAGDAASFSKRNIYEVSSGSPGSRTTMRSSLAESFQWMLRGLSPARYSRMSNVSAGSKPGLSGEYSVPSASMLMRVPAESTGENVSGNTVHRAAASAA